MRRGDLLRGWVLAAAMGALGLPGCQGGLTTTDASARSIRAESRRAADAGVSERRGEPTGERADPSASADERSSQERERSDADGGRDGDPEDGERAEAAGVDAPYVSAAALAGSDLEFSDGLPEPPQQSVVPPPRPWAPAAEAEQGPQPVIEDVWPDKGVASGGERVVIRGEHLEPAQVVFGLVPARIVGVSDSRDAVTVVAPAAEPGSAAIVVTNRDGNYAVAERTFRYYR